MSALLALLAIPIAIIAVVVAIGIILFYGVGFLLTVGYVTGQFLVVLIVALIFKHFLL
jgi:hypothetical protein